MRAEAEAETLLRKLAANPRAHPLVQAQAWAEIAQAHDRREEYAEAMSSMLKCKELLRPHAPAARKESEVVLRQLCDLTESLSAADFERWKQVAQAFPPQKNAVLTGFPRSGTTLLEQILDAHSGLVSSDEREAFARDIFPALWMTPATPRPTARALDGTPVEKLRFLRRAVSGLHGGGVECADRGSDAPGQEPDVDVGAARFSAALPRGAGVDRLAGSAGHCDQLFHAVPAAEPKQRLLSHPGRHGPPLRRGSRGLAPAPRNSSLRPGSRCVTKIPWPTSSGRPGARWNSWVCPGNHKC